DRNTPTEPIQAATSTGGLVVRKQARVREVASAVRRSPARSSASREVTATVRSQSIPANGSSTEENTSTRKSKGPARSAHDSGAAMRIPARSGEKNTRLEAAVRLAE